MNEEEEELRYYMVLFNDKFKGFISGYTKEEAENKLKKINYKYTMSENYVLKPKK